ncbi:MBL fold metallo-hydrolase [Methanohalobium sp.]|uniref:MBL fold metallo-hydrolase n=1 Tax=Methanohalobium sp. TaxID=2837493 RepID=UPI0025EE4B52|nr:MBL fold metallo-hydrolase [Methanohalobium sp.]
MKLDFRGGCREVGRSAVYLNDEILIDYGMKPGEITQYPLNDLHPKSVLVTHGHLDHCGALTNLIHDNSEIFMTPPTADFTEMLAEDTLKIAENENIPPAYNLEDLKYFMNRTNKVDTGMEFSTNGYKVQFYDAGHIPGSSSVYIETKEGESICYTGDVNTIDTRLLYGADLFPDADTLIIESTYFGENHTPRKKLESEFIESLKSTLDIGGNVIIPAFAIGRTHEILMMLDSYGINTHVDGMGLDAYSIMKKYPDYIKNIKHLKKAFRDASVVKGKKRKKLPRDSSVIVTTAGMLNGGPVLQYLDKIYKDPKSKIMLTGYQVEGTNGRSAIENSFIENNGIRQKLQTEIEQYDFSAHCGDRELKQLVKDFCDRGTERVITMHGDNSEGFARWIENEIGVETYAPSNGDIYKF